MRWRDSAAFWSGKRPISSAATKLLSVVAARCWLMARAWPTIAPSTTKSWRTTSSLSRPKRASSSTVPVVSTAAGRAKPV